MDKRFLQEIEDELLLLDDSIKQAVFTRSKLIKEPLEKMISSGGKRLRPAMVLAAARFGEYEFEKVKPLAVAVELIHTATLVHDDIIDDSPTRRGIPSIQAQLGKDVAVFTGDYIFCKVFELLASLKDFEILQLSSRVLYKICEGEIKQREDLYNTNITIKNYLYRIQRKTALLFALSCQLGATVAKAPKKVVQNLYRYGIKIGTAFQITDDILDIIGNQHELGKPAGADIREGVITLPAIYALKNESGKKELNRILGTKDCSEDQVERALEIIKESGGVEFSKEIAKSYAEKAKKVVSALPETNIKKVLSDVAELVYNRNN